MQGRPGFRYNDWGLNLKERYPQNFGTRVSEEQLEILEVGPAEGVVTRQLLTFFPRARVTAIDFQQKYVEATRSATRSFGDRIRVLHGDGYFLARELERLLGEVPEFDRVLMMNNLWDGVGGRKPQEGMSEYHLRIIGENTFPVIKEGGVWDITNYSQVLRLQKEGLRLKIVREQIPRGDESFQKIIRALTKRPYRS